MECTLSISQIVQAVNEACPPMQSKYFVIGAATLMGLGVALVCAGVALDFFSFDWSTLGYSLCGVGAMFFITPPVYMLFRMISTCQRRRREEQLLVGGKGDPDKGQNPHVTLSNPEYVPNDPTLFPARSSTDEAYPQQEPPPLSYWISYPATETNPQPVYGYVQDGVVAYYVSVPSEGSDQSSDTAPSLPGTPAHSTVQPQPSFVQEPSVEVQVIPSSPMQSVALSKEEQVFKEIFLGRSTATAPPDLDDVSDLGLGFYQAYEAEQDGSQVGYLFVVFKIEQLLSNQATKGCICFTNTNNQWTIESVGPIRFDSVEAAAPFLKCLKEKAVQSHWYQNMQMYFCSVA